MENTKTQTATWNGDRYELPYNDGIHMLQTYISADGDSWELIGYDGVLRYIDEDEFFDSSEIVLVGGPAANPTPRHRA